MLGGGIDRWVYKVKTIIQMDKSRSILGRNQLKMKFVIVIAVLLAVAWAAPQGNLQDVVILRYDSENNGIDSYSFLYETSDGTIREEKGTVKNAGTDDEILVVEGSVTWTAPDGQKYTVKYRADENGYQPEGDHLPRAR